MSMRVKRVQTPISSVEMSAALITAWQKLFSKTPSKQQLALVMAQNNLETGHRKSMWNYNVGNITTNGGEPFFDDLTTSEQTRPGEWKRMNLKYKAYKNLEAGVLDYLTYLSKRPAFKELLKGDPTAFSKALKQQGYYTADEKGYTSSMVSLTDEYLKSNDYEKALHHKPSKVVPIKAAPSSTPSFMSIIDKYLKQIAASAPLVEKYGYLVEENIKYSFIRKLPNGKYRVLSESGKNLGTFDSKSKAKKRLQQVEYFKHDTNEANDVIDLTDVDSFTYSAILRKLRQQTSKEVFQEFLQLFKTNFDKSVKKKLKDPEKIALQDSLIKFNESHKIRLSKDLIKNAGSADLGDAESVGKYLSNIVKFTFSKVPSDKQPRYLSSLKNKLLNMNTNEISSKEMPDSASIGHAISFIKYVLFNQESDYIRKVLQTLVKNL